MLDIWQGWSSAYSLTSTICVCLMAVIVFFMFKEKNERDRPHLSVTFEPANTVGSFVIRNTGSIPATLQSIRFNNSFSDQLRASVQKQLTALQVTDKKIAPGDSIVINLGEPVFYLCAGLDVKTCIISYAYSEAGRRKLYKDIVRLELCDYLRTDVQAVSGR